MTTQFSQRVTFELALLWSSNSSYFILSPQTVSINNHCLSFGSFQSFSELDSILPHYSPAFPVDFSQFGQAWCDETIRAYFNHLNISSYINQIQFERVRYQPNGNNASVVNSSYCILSCSLLLNNQIDTDFDNLFANLITSLDTLLAPISQISLSLLGINNIFPTLVHNLEALNENNVPVSIAQILRDKQINVDMSGAEVSLDDTNLVTQLQNIYTILASQNSNQAAICSAIQNKDNQSDIVDALKNIFLINNNGNFVDIFTGHRFDNPPVSSFSSLANIINKLRNVFLTSNVSASNDVNLNQRLLAPLLTLCDYQTAEGQTAVIPNNVNLVMKNSNLLHIQNKINDIETKLEQNLPFATLTDVTLNVDTVKKVVTQELNEKE